MTLFLADEDLTLYCGDALEVLCELPDGSVDCCVTSPPYWGLRDYGTGEWEGGDEGCDHKESVARHDGGRVNVQGFNGSARADSDKGAMNYRDVCGKCGARRVDRQIGLEQTPDEYVAAMVAVFREVRRVLADHGTCWVNLGDSYTSNPGSGQERGNLGGLAGADSLRYRDTMRQAHSAADSRPRSGLKPKDLVGIPWRVAFALQTDGWWLRSDIIWAKPNPMPESVTDRPTKAHEYVFMLTKVPRYYFDAEAVREPHSHDGRKVTTVQGGDGSIQHRDGERWPNGGRNIRSVWSIATQPYPEAHFATFPEELPRRAIAAGCPLWVCGTCGKPRERIVERGVPAREVAPSSIDRYGSGEAGVHRKVGGQYQKWLDENPAQTVGWSDCGHNNYRPGTVLDPFAGAGTTLHVARKLGRRSIGIELNPEYCLLIATRTSQLSLLAGDTA